MVIDKLNQRQNLMAPLLGSKGKETFYQLKQEYEHFLLHAKKVKNYLNLNPFSNAGSINTYNINVGIGLSFIKEDIIQISLSLLALEKLIDEYFNFSVEEKDLKLKEIKSIWKNIDSEYNVLIEDINKYNENNNQNDLIEEEIKSSLIINESIIKKINEKFNKVEKKEEEVSKEKKEIKETKDTNNRYQRPRRNWDNRNNFRNFGNSITVHGEKYTYTIEEDNIMNTHNKLILMTLFLMLVVIIYLFL